MSDTIVKILPYRVDLAEPIKKTYFDTLFATQDNEAHRVEVQLMRGNTQIQLAGAQVTAYFIRYSDDATITLTGVVSGNVASVTLTDACYKKSGQFALVIKAKMDSVTNTVFYGEGTIFVSNTDIIPGDDSDTPAQDGGSNESSGESVPWLVGSTDEITPTQVKEALLAKQNVMITYTSPDAGDMRFSHFLVLDTVGVVASSCTAELYGNAMAMSLVGDWKTNVWSSAINELVKSGDIPTALPNPYYLNIKDSSGKTLALYNGSQNTNVTIPTVAGEAGYTPVKGVDYWTDADQESIVQQVITALGTPVFGRVDENNNIILTGNLTDETYTLKYEDAAGNLITIGTLNGEDVQTYVNRLKESIADDGSLYNGGKGWKADTRLNSSGNRNRGHGLHAVCNRRRASI